MSSCVAGGFENMLQTSMQYRREVFRFYFPQQYTECIIRGNEMVRDWKDGDAPGDQQSFTTEAIDARIALLNKKVSTAVLPRVLIVTSPPWGKLKDVDHDVALSAQQIAVN